MRSPGDTPNHSMTAYVHTQVLLRKAGGLSGAVEGTKESDQPGEQSGARRQLPRGLLFWPWGEITTQGR